MSIAIFDENFNSIEIAETTGTGYMSVRSGWLRVNAARAFSTRRQITLRAQNRLIIPVSSITTWDPVQSGGMRRDDMENDDVIILI